MTMEKTQNEIELNSVFIKEPFSCWDSKLKKGFVWAEVNCILYDFAEIDNPLKMSFEICIIYEWMKNSFMYFMTFYAGLQT